MSRLAWFAAGALAGFVAGVAALVFIALNMDIRAEASPAPDPDVETELDRQWRAEGDALAARLGLDEDGGADGR